MQKAKTRVLLIAEAANPHWTSVPLVGWSLSQAIGNQVDVHLVTHVRNRADILEEGLVEDKDFTVVDSEVIARPIWKISSFLRGGKGKGWTTGAAFSVISYYYFEYLVWKKFRHKIMNHEFDIVHRITPLSPTIPSLISRKCRHAQVPFIIGPLNGGIPWPKGFNDVRHQEREWLSYVRSCYKLMPGYRSTRKNATAILIASRATWGQIEHQYQDKCFYLPENGIDPERFSVARVRCASRPIKVIFVGRLVPYKGADMLLEAVSPLVTNGNLTVDIIGDGPQTSFIKAFIERKKIGHGVTMQGWVAHYEIQKYLANSDILVFPSIREFGGTVVLEAMAMGVVPLVVNYGGPAELVTEKTGFMVELGTRPEIVQRLRKILSEIVADPRMINEKASLAKIRANKQFTWEYKAIKILEVYQWSLKQSDKRPDFPMPIPDLN